MSRPFGGGRGLDVQTGKVLRARLTPAHEDVIGWLRSLPGPVQATEEAGPTGFGLARAVQAAKARGWSPPRRGCCARPGTG
jgi:hypothetical protein